MIPDFEIKVTPGSYEEVSERFKTYLRFRFGIDPASVFITGATGSGKSTASISLAIQYVKQGIPALAIDINQTMSPEHICQALSPEFELLVIRHNLYRKAVASDLITPKIYDGCIEDSYDTAYGLSEIISKGYRLGPTQAAILTDAIKSRVDCRETSVLKVEGRKSPEREIFTDEQVTLILSQKNTPTGQMVIALLACGVRIYELLHFKHEDFHRTESGAYLIGGCKTEAGRNRIIPILDFGIPVFEHAYATSVENGPLFPNGKGGFWNEKNWRNRKFYPFLEEIGIQPNPYDENGKRKPEFAGKLATYTPYTTRHTYASLCDRAGVNKDILKRAVAHTPKSKTLDEVYLHPKATQMIEAFDKANQLVNDEVLTTTKA